MLEKNRTGIKVSKAIFYMMIFGTIFYPVVLRGRLLPAQISIFNPFYIMASVLYIIYLSNKKVYKRIPFYLCIAILGTVQLYSNLKSHSIFFTSIAFISLVIPLLFLGDNILLKISSRELRLAVKLFDIVMTIIFITGIIHIIT